MATGITRSPFVKKQTTDYGYGKDSEGNTTYTDANGVTTIVVSAGQSPSLNKEKFALGKAVNKAGSLTRFLPFQPQAQKDILESLQQLKETGKTPKSVTGGIFNTLGQIINYTVGEGPKEVLQATVEAVKPVQRYGQSAINELAEGLTQLTRLGYAEPLSYKKGIYKGQKIEASWKDFVRQAKDPNFKLFGKDSVTGMGGVAGGTLQFIADVATDPTTYVGLPASQASKAQKVALATRVVTELYPKYPELKSIPNLLDNVVRYGAVELPDYVRKNENIFVGVKYMGYEIKNSSAIAKAWRHTLGEVSPYVGDVLYKYKPNWAIKTARGGVAPLVAVGVGRGIKSGDDWISTYLGGIAEHSASLRSRGRAAGFSQTHLAKGYGILRAVEQLPDTAQQELYKIIENRSPVYASSEEVQNIVDAFKKWDDEAYQAVDDYRVQQIRNKWGALPNELGVIDDHLYHSMTDEAREWMVSEGYKTKWFDDLDFSGVDIETGKGISSHRKLRDATFDAEGNLVHAEKFMDEDVIVGSIEAINEISMRKIGIPWFKTDIPTIMMDSLHSYSRMMERTAYYDRMMDFGPAVIKPLIKHVVPDAALVAELEDVATKLLATQRSLKGRISRGVKKLAGTKEAAATELENVSQIAIDVLSGKIAQRVSVTAETETILKEIAKIKKTLNKATKAATKLKAELKGESNDVIISLVKQVDAFEKALTEGTADRFLTLQELHKEYLSWYPNANDFEGKSAEWLAERIVRAAGGADAIEAREASRVAQNNFIREQIDALPETSIEERQFLENKLIENETELEAIQRINEVKNNATYASEGWIYGFVPDTSGEPVPFQIFTTAPMDNEFGTFSQMDDAIAGHAIPEGELLDLRDPETFSAFLNPEFWAEDLNKAWRQVGITEYISESDIANMIENNGVLDETFVRVNPEKAELLSGLWDMKTRIDAARASGEIEKLTHNELGQFFEWFKDVQQRIAYSFSPNNSDAVGGIASQWWFKNLVDDAAGNGYRGVLMPASNIFGDGYHFASDEWAVLVPDNWKTPKIGQAPTDPWQTVKGNKFLQNSLDSTMEMHQLSLLDNNEKLRNMGLDIEESLAKRSELTAQLEETQKQDTAFRTLMNLRNANSVLVDGKYVPREQVLAKLATADAELKKVYDSIDKEVRQQIEAKFGVAELNTQRLKYEERLPMLLDQAKVLEAWTEGTGAGLKQEIQDMILLIKNKPAKGSTGASNSAYVDKVLKSIETSSLIDEPKVAEAYDRVTTILHADELKLAAVNEELEESLDWLQMAEMGLLNGKLVNDVAEQGWEEIKGMGLQMPKEVLDVWGPNVKKLLNQVEFKSWMKNLDRVNNYWKRWVTSTPGFFVRNGFSGMFMNYADGVTNDAIEQGLKWATFQNETKRGIAKGDTFANWTQRAKITDPNELAKAEWVIQVVLATGHGVTDDFAAPTIGRRGAVLTDKYFQFYNRKNKFVERALRLPMAIDSFNKGQTFDEAVTRINRIHFDYSDLSKLDKVAKRVVPFWVWTSRNVPLQLTQMMARPKAYYEYERVKKSFPVNPNLIMPKWIADKDALGIMGNWVLTPDLPHIRLAQQLQSITTPQGVLGQAGLPFKLPAELLANRQLGISTGPFRQDEVKGYTAFIAKFLGPLMGTKYVYYDKNKNLVMDSRVNYILESVFPALGQFNRVTGGVFGGKDTLEERMVSSWWNYFGVPAREIGEKQQESEIVRRKWATNELIKDLEKLVNQEEAQQLEEQQP